ncbi:hypothetical protein ACFL1N_12780 [Thermodesulfobacteriota bacterium]
MKTERNIRDFVSEKIGGFMEKTPGFVASVAFVITLVIVAGIIT